MSTNAINTGNMAIVTTSVDVVYMIIITDVKPADDMEDFTEKEASASRRYSAGASLLRPIAGRFAHPIYPATAALRL
jgi:hypothetical protein